MNATADNPSQRGFFERLWDRYVPRTPLFRFLTYVRPHLWLVAGGSICGVLKFVLPLSYILASKYIIDVLLLPQPKLDRYDCLIDQMVCAN